MPKIIALVAAIGILLLVNWSIWGKEKHLAEGEIVYLHLAPVDPRSLMQGDYMALRFQLGNNIRSALPQSNDSSAEYLRAGGGQVVVTLDNNRVATFNRLRSAENPLAANELALAYRVRNNQVKFATNAFFFQEGQAEIFEDARYGQFRVNAKGEPLLVAMYDADLQQLGGRGDGDEDPVVLE